MKLIFSKRRISVDEFGWHVELDQKYVKSFLDAMAMNHCKSMATPGSKGQEGNSATGETGRKGTSRVPESGAGICQYMTEHRFDIAFSTNEIMREGSWGKLDDVIHVTVDADWAETQRQGAQRPEEYWQLAPCFTVRHWSVTQATVSPSSAESGETTQRVRAILLMGLGSSSLGLQLTCRSPRVP